MVVENIVMAGCCDLCCGDKRNLVVGIFFLYVTVASIAEGSCKKYCIS